MKKKKQEIRIHLDMSLQQAQIISEAVEEYMRLRMYQFSDLADVLARRDFQYDQSDPQCGEKFKAYMQRRDEITELFEQIRRVALDGAECADRSEDADIAGDLWSVLRHEIYKAKTRPQGPMTPTRLSSLQGNRWQSAGLPRAIFTRNLGTGCWNTAAAAQRTAGARPSACRSIVNWREENRNDLLILGAADRRLCGLLCGGLDACCEDIRT